MFSLRNIAKIRKYLTGDSAKCVVHALITSKLDNCNALSYGLPQQLLFKLQSVQNSAARVVTRTRKYDHITRVERAPLAPHNL